MTDTETIVRAFVDACNGDHIERVLELLHPDVELRVAGDRALMTALLHLTGRESGPDVQREWSYVFIVRDGKLLRQEGFDDAAAAEAAFAAP